MKDVEDCFAKRKRRDEKGADQEFESEWSDFDGGRRSVSEQTLLSDAAAAASILVSRRRNTDPAQKPIRLH